MCCVLQEYISHQIVDVTWQEFQTSLATNVSSIDDLHVAHNTYLDNALFRLLFLMHHSTTSVYFVC